MVESISICEEEEYSMIGIRLKTSHETLFFNKGRHMRLKKYFEREKNFLCFGDVLSRLEK